MWAGLLASGATADGRDEGNMMFTDLVGRMTPAQARLVNRLGEQSAKGRTRFGLVVPKGGTMIPLAGLKAIMELDDIQQIDRELDHLSASLGVTAGGLLTDGTADTPLANIHLTALGLQLYARCRGAKDPILFYGLQEESPVKVLQGLTGSAVVPDLEGNPPE